MITIVFVGGGTGGHIFPGLAIVDELKALIDARIVWIGSSRGIDREIVERHGIEFIGIPSGKLRRYADIRNAIDLFRIVAGFFCSVFALLRLRPSLVFSKGGFVSVPPCVAAALLRIPLVTHECDYSPGLATRINARFTKDIFVSYDETVALFPPKYRSRVTVTGNPVRSAFYSGDARRGREFLGCADPAVPVIFAQGGSLGARQVNGLVAECAERLCALGFVAHQTGNANLDQAADAALPLVAERYRLYAFIRDEIADVLASASVVVARSGANTVWECAAAGKPMVLIPLDRGSSRGDQIENARFFVKAGAAVMLTGDEANAESLARAVGSILGDAKLRESMASNALALASSRPARVIASALADKISAKAGACNSSEGDKVK
jgi:UDP-N-acetylglucosamine--N-acetylmuramyl-(pentapeptide) pyrophosphoryl-undecaprenol N-acetylglucosamine transferase